MTKRIVVRPVRVGALANPEELHELVFSGGNTDNVVRLTDVELDALRIALDAYPTDVEQPKIWAPLAIREVRAGDVIRMPGKPGSERTVEGVSPVLPWHVHPAANAYAPQEKPAEWSEVRVKFVGMEAVSSFKDPAFMVEIETTKNEVRIVELLGGWGARA